MAQKTQVHVLRHGEVFNPEKILYGRLPGYKLSELGLKMADRAADFFKDKNISLVVYFVHFCFAKFECSSLHFLWQ